MSTDIDNIRTSVRGFKRYGNSHFKKTEKMVKQVNEDYLAKVKAEKPVNVDISQILSTEMDEMWSFYYDKSHQIWLWWAVDHATNTPLAFTFGTREHKNLDELLGCSSRFRLARFMRTIILPMKNGLLRNCLLVEKRIHKKSKGIT